MALCYNRGHERGPCRRQIPMRKPEMKENLLLKSAVLALSCLVMAEAFPFDPSACAVPERFRNHPIFTMRHCSVNFGFLARRGYFSRPEVFAQAAKIKAAGANWVTLNTHFCQEMFCSRRTFLDFEWSSGEEELAAIVAELHRQGLHILLKPCLTNLDSSWMGTVCFPPPGQQQIQGVTQNYWGEWFDSLGQCLTYFAQFAERHGVEAMIIGAEYNGTIHHTLTPFWRKTIATVRRHFSGPITYEFTEREVSNDDFTAVDSKKVAEIEWLADLDFLAISAYPLAAPACDLEKWPTLAPIPIDTMKKHLAAHKGLMAGISKTFGNKPILFTEIGTRSCRGNVTRPWDYLTESIRDEDEQANYMEAVFETFSDLPFWMGLSWWKWDETQKNRPHYSDDPSKDRGFVIYGKKACEVLKKWSK